MTFIFLVSGLKTVMLVDLYLEEGFLTFFLPRLEWKTLLPDLKVVRFADFVST